MGSTPTIIRKKTRSDADRKKHAGWRDCPRCKNSVSTNGRNYFHHMQKCDPDFFAEAIDKFLKAHPRTNSSSASASASGAAPGGGASPGNALPPRHMPSAAGQPRQHLTAAKANGLPVHLRRPTLAGAFSRAPGGGGSPRMVALQASAHGVDHGMGMHSSQAVHDAAADRIRRGVRTSDEDEARTHSATVSFLESFGEKVSLTQQQRKVFVEQLTYLRKVNASVDNAFRRLEAACGGDWTIFNADIFEQVSLLHSNGTLETEVDLAAVSRASTPSRIGDASYPITSKTCTPPVGFADPTQPVPTLPRPVESSTPTTAPSVAAASPTAFALSPDNTTGQSAELELHKPRDAANNLPRDEHAAKADLAMTIPNLPGSVAEDAAMKDPGNSLSEDSENQTSKLNTELSEPVIDADAPLPRGMDAATAVRACLTASASAVHVEQASPNPGVQASVRSVPPSVPSGVALVVDGADALREDEDRSRTTSSDGAAARIGETPNNVKELQDEPPREPSVENVPISDDLAMTEPATSTMQTPKLVDPKHALPAGRQSSSPRSPTPTRTTEPAKASSDREKDRTTDDAAVSEPMVSVGDDAKDTAVVDENALPSEQKSMAQSDETDAATPQPSPVSQYTHVGDTDNEAASDIVAAVSVPNH